MSSAQDPFYIVKEEIQESIDKLLSTFRQWEHLISNGGEQEDLGKELLASCESIEWQVVGLNQHLSILGKTVSNNSAKKVEELDKTISVAARDPAFYGISEIELVKRRKWTRTARDQVNTVRKAVSDGKGPSIQGATAANGMHRELMKLTVDYSHQINGSSQYNQANDDFISSESDRQLLLMRQQDEDLDELSASVQRIGHVGLTIHDELLGQEKIIDELGMELDSTSNRLEFLQKKVAVVMKKAGAKGQIMMILFLVVLFLILFFLVFFT